MNQSFIENAQLPGMKRACEVRIGKKAIAFRYLARTPGSTKYWAKDKPVRDVPLVRKAHVVQGTGGKHTSGMRAGNWLQDAHLIPRRELSPGVKMLGN